MMKIKEIFKVNSHWAAVSSLPAGRPITFDEIGNLIIRIGDFITWGSLILIVIMITLSGVKYAMAGPDTTKATKAKDSLKNAIIGALVILGVGVIIQTVAGLVTREFFCRISVFSICLLN